MRKFLEVQGSPATKRVPCDQMEKGTRETKETGAQTVRQAECREFGLLLLVQNWRPVGASRSCGSYCLGFALLSDCDHPCSSMIQYHTDSTPHGIYRNCSRKISSQLKNHAAARVLLLEGAHLPGNFERPECLMICGNWTEGVSYIWIWSQWENKSLICTLCSPLLTSVARPSESPAVAAPYCGVQWGCKAG